MRTERTTPSVPTRLAAWLSAVPRRLTSVAREFLAPAMWSPWRIVGESLLSVALGLLAALTQALQGPLNNTAWMITAGLATALLTLLRRVLPAMTLLATAVGMAAFSGLAPLLLIASWSAGRRITSVGKAVGTFAAAYALGLGLFLAEGTLSLPLALATVAPLLLVTVIIPGLISRYWSQHRTLADTLREYNAQMLRERMMIAGQARMRERQRIAQDMHDSLGHQLTLISVHAGALEVDRTLSGQQREAVGVLRGASVAALHELREVVGLLRDRAESAGQPTVPGDSAATADEHSTVPSRGVAGIDALVEASRGASATVDLRRSGMPGPLTPAADHAAYRIVQEGLTNAHKHAPGAPITVELRYEPDALIVEVANGAAPEPPANRHDVVSGGQGLTGLRERTRLIGGMVHAGPTPHGGFRLAGVLPYTSPEGDAPPLSPGDTEPPSAADFPGRFPTGTAGGDVPTTDDSVLPKELAKVMGRSTTRSCLAIGCGGLVLVLLLLVVAGVLGTVFLAGETGKALIDRQKYDALKVGQPEAEARAELPSGTSILTTGLTKGAPPVPKGATCATFMSSEDSTSWNSDPVFRFCFRDGKLIEKKSFEARR
ncbi:sensor histidine kinase [Streptomyces sp. NPDC090442]|uniref:sensor histidine kinase n=1 Tax=Streptomyces sp. NPDC090442 TaxID=3365962 RepID=UPI00382F0002